jgi:hypothetical protein
MTVQERPDHVSIHLTGCAQRDADSVFGALEAAFPEPAGWDPAQPPTRRPASGAAPVVWCMNVDVRTAGVPVGSAPLTGPVLADLFGGYRPVHQVEAALAETFRVEEQGAVPGEHEMELRLRLTPRHAAQ